MSVPVTFSTCAIVQSLALRDILTDARGVGPGDHGQRVPTHPPLLKGRPSLLRLPFIICCHSLIHERLLPKVF